MRGLWLIDGSYVYKAGKSFQADNPTYEKRGIDYKKLKDCICKEFEIDNLDSWYFNSTPDPATDAQNAYHRWLKTTEPKGPNIRVKLYDLKEKKIRCRNCGKFIIRKSNRQEFCDAEECQKARNARKQKAYRERKAIEKAQKIKKKAH